jgi:hypothetical protein
MKRTLLFALISLFAFNTQAQTPRPKAPGRQAALGQRADRSAHSTAGRQVALDQSADRSAHSKELRLNNRSKFRVPAPRSALLAPQLKLRTSSSQLRTPNSSLPIRRVILYSNGVAYIERRGLVSGHAEVSLSFKQSQVDDVLKSMLVLDLGKGRIGAVSYNSSAPAPTRMAEIPFAISASTQSSEGQSSGGLAGVLSQLQGARVVVATANRTVTGSIITVEARHSQVDVNKPAVTSHRLVIASDNGQLSGFDLAEVRSIQLADEGARRDLSEFAHAAASARRRDAKTIVVTSDGAGQREMIVSYTIAAPIWKTTYRLVLDQSGQPFFQGWAIVDNVSDEDWTGIELSLVSGTPISFIQPIQNPVYRYRPIIPLRDDLNLKPQTYEPGEVGSGTGSLTGKITDANGASVPGATVTITNNATNQSFDFTTDSYGMYRTDNLPPGTYTLDASASGFKNLAVNNLNVRPGLRSKFNANLDVGGVSETVTVTASDQDSVTSKRVASLFLFGRGSVGGGGGVDRESLSNLVSRRETGVEAETTASEVGDLFEYRIDQPVTVPRDRSALIPILQTRMEGERVSIFNEQSPAHRPMSGMLLKNTSSLTLEDGSLTVIDGDAYAGEALLERLKPGEERLISFAVDLGTLVNVGEEDEDRQPTFLVRAVNGVIEAHYYHIRRKVYTLVNQTDRPRIVYLEHPRDEDEDWKLTADTAASADTADAAKPFTKTASHYRFRVKLAPHQKLEFPVVERNEQRDLYQLTNFTRHELQLFIARKYIDEKTRAALETIIALKDRVTGAEARLQQINKEAAEIAQDQQRLRENIKALTSTAEAKQLIARYVSKANDQETRLEQIEKDRRAIVDERTRLQSELDLAIRSLSLDRKLK